MPILSRLKIYFGHDVFDPFSRAYVFDWLCILIVWILSFLVSQFPVYERGFSFTDPTISFPHRHSQIGSAVNNIIALNVPICIIATGGFMRKLLLEIHHGMISVCASVGFARLVTIFLKHKIGRLRPDFLAVCKWDATLKACAGNEKHILDGRQSFPSGHSSTAFAGMTVLSLWIAGRTAALCFQQPRSTSTVFRGRVSSFLLTMAPLSWAAFVAITRMEDYRHHKEDVLVGSLIGIVTATVSYLMFWPNPFTRKSNYPRLVYDADDSPRVENLEFQLAGTEDEEV